MNVPVFIDIRFEKFCLLSYNIGPLTGNAMKVLFPQKIMIFIGIFISSLEEQAEELRAWMKSQGAEISEERSEIGENPT